MQKVGDLPRSRSRSRDAAASGGTSNRGVFTVNSRDEGRGAAGGGGGGHRGRSSSRGRTSSTAYGGSGGRGGNADIQMTSASRGRSSSRSRKTSGNAAAISAAVAAGAAAAAASNTSSSSGGRFTPRSLSLRRNKKSFDSQDNNQGGFPDKATSTPKSFDEEDYVDAGSFCSFGETLDESLMKDVKRKSKRDNDPPNYGDERSIDEESYYDEGSYLSNEGSYSMDSLDEDGTYQSLDPPAKNGTSSTWASWFGFGGDDEANDDTIMSPSDECSTQSGGSTAFEDEEKVSKEVYNRVLSKSQRGSDKDTSSARSASSAKSSAATHDREGRPLPDGKPMKRVSSFKNTWKKLKAPASPGGGSVAGSVAGSLGSFKKDKSLASEETHATASVTTKGSSKSKGSSGGGGSKGAGSSSGNLSTKVLDKRLWDTDERQRDIYCHRNGGVENLRVRQYSDVPTPIAPDHVLVKIEVRTEHMFGYHADFLNEEALHELFDALS